MDQLPQATKSHLGTFWEHGEGLRVKILGPQSYKTPWPQAEGWGDEDENLMDLAPSLSDEVFAIDMPEEYNEGTSEKQLFN